MDYFVLFLGVYKENKFTVSLGDGHEAPSKARKKGAKRLEFLVIDNITNKSVSRDQNSNQWQCSIIVTSQKHQIELLSS